MKRHYQIAISVSFTGTEEEAVRAARDYQRLIGTAATIEAIFDDKGNEIDSDPYEGSFREAADNEGARIAAESRSDGEGEN